MAVPLPTGGIAMPEDGSALARYATTATPTRSPSWCGGTVLEQERPENMRATTTGD
jgi:hypothetical protein